MSIIEHLKTIKRRMRANDLLIKNLQQYNRDLQRDALEICRYMEDCKDCPFYDETKVLNVVKCQLLDR